MRKDLTLESISMAINSSKSMIEAANKLKVQYKTLRTHAKKFNIWSPNQSGKGIIKKTHPRIKLSDILSGKKRYYSTYHLKQRLIKELGWKEICSNCKLSEWLGQKIPLELDHVNGINFDHRLENLRLLCPNCHAQTPTYRSKKRN